MKNLNLLAIISLIFFIVGCSKDDVIVTPIDKTILPTKELNKSLIKLDFEKGINNFYRYGSDSKGKSIKINMENLSSLKITDSRCAKIYRGKATEFIRWKGYDFSGNTSQFIGYDMGRCRGFSDGTIHSDFTLEKLFPKNELKFKFKYYRPGDLSGWGENILNFYISKKGELDPKNKHLVKIEPKIYKDGWAEHTEILSVNLEKGDYTITIVGGGSGSVGIDDIEFIEKK